MKDRIEKSDWRLHLHNGDEITIDSGQARALQLRDEWTKPGRDATTSATAPREAKAQDAAKPPELMTPEERKNTKRQVIAVITEKGLDPDYVVAVRNGANIEFRPANTKETDYGTVIPASDKALGKPLAVASVDDVLRAGGAPAYLEQIAKSEGSPIYRAEGIGVQKAHEAEIRDSILFRRPLSSAAVDQYGIKLPPGYVREGDRYVFKGEAQGEKPEPPDAPKPVNVGDVIGLYSND